MYGVHGRKTSTDFIGLVLQYDHETKIVTLQQRNYFEVGHEVEFFGPEINNVRMTINELWDEKGRPLDIARHPKQIDQFKSEVPLHPNKMMRREIIR